eukprot:gene4399-5148_t
MSLIDSPSFSLVEAAKYGQLRECVAYLEKVRLQSRDDELGDLLAAGDETGNTPLHWACYKGHYDIAKYLLSSGANPNAPNHDEWQTPLHWACIGGDPYIVKYMINAGGDPLLCDKRGYNSLIHAAQYNEIKVVRFLVERGVSVHSSDLLAQTPLHWAAYQGHTQLVLFLVNKGAAVDPVDSFGRTPLHWAAYKGHMDAIKALCGFGASLLFKDAEGNTPIDLCRQQNHIYIARALTIYPHHPLRKLSKIPYNLVWILTAIGMYCTLAFGLTYFSAIPAIILFFLFMGFCKLIIEPLLLPYTPNPLLPTWMLCSYTTWVIIYFKYIIPSFPDMVLTHIVTIMVLALYYYYSFKCFFSDPGTISSSTSFQDAKDFQLSVENELKVPELCTSYFIEWLVYHSSFNKGLLIFGVYESVVAAWIARLLYVQVTGAMTNVTMFELMRPPSPVTGEPTKAKPCCSSKHGKNDNHSAADNNQDKDEGPSSRASSSKSEDKADKTSLRDAILMPKRNNTSANPFDRGSVQANIREFIYDTSKWHRYFTHKTIDF